MSLQDTITRRLTDLTTELTRLDAQHANERAVLVKKLDLLGQAAKVVTPEIQLLLDQLGLVIPVV